MSEDSQPLRPRDPDQIYTPAPDEAQLTVRAVVAGCVLGSLVSAMNIYLGLKIGWTVGGSLIAAILGFSLFKVLPVRRPLSVLETNIAQTSGSAAGTMASAGGLVAPVPAVMLLGHDISWWELYLWVLSVAYLGVFFAIPLRNQYIDIEKLRFPTGTATAETIKSMFATAGEAMAKARVLLAFAITAALYTILSFFMPFLEKPPIHLLSGGMATAAAWQFKLYLGPMMLGAGFLVGTRVAASVFAGAIVSWAILGPMSLQMGWVDGAIMDIKSGPRGWILWPGVAIMVADALVSLGLSWKTVLRTFRFSKDNDAPQDDQAIPAHWWIRGLMVGGTLTAVTAYLVFDIPPWMTVIAIALSAILAAIAVRSTGETDINPVGGMGKVTQLVFGGVDPGNMTSNLMAAGISSAGASQSGDMMQDLKTGKLLGASPRKQLKAQLVGIFAGVLFVVPIFFLFTSAYELGGDTIPAPAVMAWKSVAEVMSKGLVAMPQYAGYAVLCGLIFGSLIPILKKFVPKSAPYLPSGLAFGIAFIVQAYYSITMFLGALLLILWRKSNKEQSDRFVFAVACGLVAGEGLMGIVNAGLTMLGVEPFAWAIFK